MKLNSVEKKIALRKQLDELRDQINEKTKAVKPGKAKGATTNGSVCAASYGASSLGRVIARNNRAKKRGKDKPASKKQRRYAKLNGVNLPIDCGTKEANLLIDKHFAKMKKQRHKNKNKPKMTNEEFLKMRAFESDLKYVV